MTNHPEVRINYAYLLRKVSVELDTFHNPDDTKLASEDECLQWAAEYRAEWAKFEGVILPALCEMLGVEFYRDVIDAHLAQMFIPQSEPLVINFRNKPKQFVNVLAHELCHILLTDNSKFQLNNPDTKDNLVKIWTELFGEHDFVALVHIPVHLLLKGLYLDHLKDPKRHEWDVKTSKQFRNGASYVKAWEYVDSNDYKALIAKLRAAYGAL